MWTKKHDEFLQACNISGCGELLARYILRRAKLSEPSEIEIDLRKFNKWVGKHRWSGEYHRKTLGSAINKLNDRSNGMFVILKRYSPWVYKILVRPLSFLAKIEGTKCAQSSLSSNVNPMFSADHKKASREQLLQNISKLDSLFQKLGMHYSRDALLRIWRMAGKKMSEVERAVEFMLKTHKEKMERSALIEDKPVGIFKPKGWLHDCLKYGWHYLDEDIELPFFDSISALASFVKGISPPTESMIAANG